MTKEINGVTLYDDKELGDLLAINVDTIRRMRKTGRLISVRIGHKLWTSENVIKSFLDGELLQSQQAGN